MHQNNFLIIRFIFYITIISDLINTLLCANSFPLYFLSCKQDFRASSVCSIGAIIYTANYVISTKFKFGFTVAMSMFLISIKYKTVYRVCLLHVDIAVINNITFILFNLNELLDRGI